MLNKIVARRTKEGLLAWIPTLGFWVRVKGNARKPEKDIRRQLERQARARTGNGETIYQKMQDALLLPIVVQDRRDVPTSFFRAPVLEP